MRQDLPTNEIERGVSKFLKISSSLSKGVKSKSKALRNKIKASSQCKLLRAKKEQLEIKVKVSPSACLLRIKIEQLEIEVEFGLNGITYVNMLYIENLSMFLYYYWFQHRAILSTPISRPRSCKFRVLPLYHTLKFTAVAYTTITYVNNVGVKSC